MKEGQNMFSKGQRVITDEYRKNYDRIFGKKEKQEREDDIPDTQLETSSSV